MNRRKFLRNAGIATGALSLSPAFVTGQSSGGFNDIPVGMIGLDTSHAVAFTKIINDRNTGYKVTHAFPQGSLDIESSVSRIPRYTKEMEDLGIDIVSSIPDLLKQVEVVLLETNDGRRHLEQARLVIEAGKPLFIDKPMAASLEDCIQIFDLANEKKVPVFSASSLRYAPSTQAVRAGKVGKVLGADTYSPATIEPTHPDLFWYGIHGVEALFTIMGKGCQTVRRIYAEDTDIVIGKWEGERIGIFRGIRSGKKGYGGTAYGEEGIAEAGIYEGYDHLVLEIIEFFKTGKSPIDQQETLEIFAFMQAAEVSKRKKGKEVSLAKVLDKAKR